MVFGILIFLNKSIGINFGILIFIKLIIRIQCIFYTWVFYVKNNTIFIAGNGGAAATAITMANDLGFDVLKKTKIKKTKRKNKWKYI